MKDSRLDYLGLKPYSTNPIVLRVRAHDSPDCRARWKAGKSLKARPDGNGPKASLFTIRDI